MDKVIKELLEAKDNRAEQRNLFADQVVASLSLNLNIPGYPKSNEITKQFFKHSLKKLKRFLLANRIDINTNQEYCEIDKAGDFYLVPIGTDALSICEIKEITERFEEEHPLGRLLDVDITDKNGHPVSSGKAKLCYFCNQQAAIACMRTQKHSYEEMRYKIDEDIKKYLHMIQQDEVCKNLAVTALKSLLHEVSLSPKPGLVDRFSCGSHDDMDFSTFINSSAVLSVYFKEIAEFGYEFKGENLKSALPELRRIGLLMEEDMFAETNGVNTHKGAIFLLGFSLFISAYLIACQNFSYHSFVELLKGLNGNLVEKELGKKLYSKAKTHGEECFQRYGKKGQGIRGEVQAGLPSVFEHAIPVLSSHLQDKNIITDSLLQKSLTHTLLALIANNEDSNILFRRGIEALEDLKQKAQKAFDCFGESDFDEKYKGLINFCAKNHISPGGSADLLAVSYFVFTVNQKYA